MRATTSLCIALGASLWVRAAAAQSAPDRSAADQLFEDGREALARNEVDVACTHFEASSRLEPAAGTLLNLGACRERQSRGVEAWTAYRDALRILAAGDARRAYASERIAALQSKLARVSMRWSEPPPVGVRVRLDGRPVTPPYEAPRWLEPSTVRIAIEAPGHAARTLTLHLDAATSTVITLGAGPPLTAPRTSARSPWKPIGWTAAGVGAATLSVASVFGVVALMRSGDAQERCAGSLSCTREQLRGARNEAASGQRYGTLSTASFVAGGIVLAGGVAILLSNLGRPAAPSRTAAVVRAATIGLEF